MGNENRPLTAGGTFWSAPVLPTIIMTAHLSLMNSVTGGTHGTAGIVICLEIR